MKLHTKSTTERLHKMAEALASEADRAGSTFDDAKFQLNALQAQREKIGFGRVPGALVLKIERAKVLLSHAEVVYDKACEARNALRSLVTAGGIEL